MKTVTLCGSMRFEEEMRRIAWELETRWHWNVLQCVYSPPGITVTEQEMAALTWAHYRKIGLSDAIYVVDIGGYVGESVKREIGYAGKLGKEVFFHSQMES